MLHRLAGAALLCAGRDRVGPGTGLTLGRHGLTTTAGCERGLRRRERERADEDASGNESLALSGVQQERRGDGAEGRQSSPDWAS